MARWQCGVRVKWGGCVEGYVSASSQMKGVLRLHSPLSPSPAPPWSTATLVSIPVSSSFALSSAPLAGGGIAASASAAGAASASCSAAGAAAAVAAAGAVVSAQSRATCAVDSPGPLGSGCFRGRPRLRRGWFGSGSGSGLGERMNVLPSSSTTSIAHPFHPRRVFFLAAAPAEPAGVDGALSNGVARVAFAEVPTDVSARPVTEPARAPSDAGSGSGASDEGAGLTSDDARRRVSGVLPRPGGGVSVSAMRRRAGLMLDEGAGDGRVLDDAGEAGEWTRARGIEGGVVVSMRRLVVGVKVGPEEDGGCW